MNNQGRNLRVSRLDSPKPSASEAGELREGTDFWPILDAPLPSPGTPEEDQRFAALQTRLKPLWQNLSVDDHVEQVVVVVPSLSLDPEELRKLKGIEHYEERLLFLLILLGMPRTRVVFVSSQPIHEGIIDYYLQLLPGIPYSHARRRLHMFSTYDSSPDQPLTQKILARPALLYRLRECVRDTRNAYLTVFNVTPLEKTLSVALGIPLLGADPAHLHFGSKSGARKIFRQTRMLFPDGFEDLRDEVDLSQAIVELHARNPDLQRVILKLDEGFSGEGNAIYPLTALKEVWHAPRGDRRRAARRVRETLPLLTRMQAKGLSWERYLAKFRHTRGIVEAFLEGEQKASPSVQMRLTPMGEAQIISTHDQILGGEDRQVFLGCRFPAEERFRPALHQAALEIGRYLSGEGLIERLSIDFLVIPDGEDWKLYAVEINLRKGGTTHPFRTLQFLTGGRYDPETGLFQTSTGVAKYYVASDNLVSECYRGMTPEDLIDVTTYTGLHYNSCSNTGVVFHMIGALSQYGKLGMTCVGNSPEEAQDFYDRTLTTLGTVCQSTDWMV